MNKKVLVLAACLIIVISLVLSIYFINKGSDDDIKYETDYILKVKEDHVAVYKDEKEIESFPTVNYHSLPEYDRNQLKNGMTFKTLEEVYQIIEDFDG